MKTVLKFILLIAIISSCKKNKDDFTEQVLPEKELGAINLVFPDNNLICTEGEDIGNNQVSINFMWTASENASTYNLELTNLDNNEITNTSSTTTSKSITLPKDTQFSWKVIAALDDKTKESSIWSFYSEGIATENFAPFPAEITAIDQTNGFVEVSWQGADLDNDIATYDLHFGSDENNLEFIVSTTNDDSTSSLPITYGTDYFIEVLTTDSRDNSSISKKKINF